jgi:DinB superfamily
MNDEMADDSRTFLLRQFDIAWKLAQYHLGGLSTEECLWRPARTGPHVHQGDDGRWRADWPEDEGYELGPPSIAWLTCHIDFWWSMVLDHAFGEATLSREDVLWPGSADAVRERLEGRAAEWRAAVERVTPGELQSDERTRWPFMTRAFGDVVAWVNIELTKNAAEIGYARFLYAVRGP